MSFLKVDANDRRRAGDYTEPITHVSRRYDRKLNLEGIARELLLPIDDKLASSLGLPSMSDLTSQLKLSETFQRIGLEPLSRGEVIARSVWEKSFHATARAFIPLEKAEQYVTRLHNRSTNDAAVLLTVDGLTIFAFSTEGNFGSQVIVPAGRFVDVTGWYFAADDTRAFLLTSYPESAVGKKGIPTTSVGVITATFAASWKPSATAPNDEVGARSADTATGIGEKTGQRWVSEPRVIGKPRSVVSVRYNRPD